MNDPYTNVAGKYDRIFENMNKGLRVAGLRMFRPSKGMDILDVGCGTGSHLELYRRYECNLFGIDISPSMLAVARARLGGSARLDLGDAANLPYEDRRFDFILSMLTLHEMMPGTRSKVLSEMKRVVKGQGHILLIDFHTGPYQPGKGWMSKLVILVSEFAAGWENFKNYRHFMVSGGLPKLAALNGLRVVKQSILAGGTITLCLTSPE